MNRYRGSKKRRLPIYYLPVFALAATILAGPWVFHPLLLRHSGLFTLLDALLLFCQFPILVPTILNLTGLTGRAYYVPRSPGTHVFRFNPKFGDYVPNDAMQGDEWFVFATLANALCCGIALLAGYVYHTPDIDRWLGWFFISELVVVAASIKFWLGR